MSAALINRSLTTIRTELEFLHDSDVIDKSLFDKLVASLPQKYEKDMKPWGVDKIVGNARPSVSVDDVSQSLASVTVQDNFTPPPHPPTPASKPESAVIGYCKALYNYDAQELGDLRLSKDDRIAVVEHLSSDWWKGYKQLDSNTVGVFPANYVSEISESDFKTYTRTAPAPQNEKASYSEKSNNDHGPPAYQAPPGSYGGYQQPMSQQPMQQQPMQQQPMQQQPMQQQPMQQQPLYGGYAQFPPPSTNYYPPQPQPQQLAPPPQEIQQQSSGSSHPHLKKFGSKLGNAAIFGAGATIGSDIVNLIF